MDKTTMLVREIIERLELLIEEIKVSPQDVTAEVGTAEAEPITEQVVSSATAAKFLGISRRTMITWLGEGRVPGAWKVEGTRWMIPASSLDNVVLRAPKPSTGRKRRTTPEPSPAIGRLHQRWTEREDQELLQLLEQGYPYKSVAAILRRTEKAVTCRATNLRNGYAGPAVVEELPDLEVQSPADAARAALAGRQLRSVEDRMPVVPEPVIVDDETTDSDHEVAANDVPAPTVPVTPQPTLGLFSRLFRAGEA